MRKLYWNDSNSRALIVQKLLSEKVVVGSSDTVLGLLAPVTRHGCLLLNEIKVRKDKPYIILIESALKASHFVPAQELARVTKLLESCWPGPLTLIFKAREDLPSWAKASDGTVSLRVPSHPGLLAILPHFQGLFSTSANVSGQPVPLQVEDIDTSILSQVAALVVDQDIQEANLPSTILDCSGSQIKVIRQGAYSIERLRGIANLAWG
jgi:L-threonylcarbamoyladenylate synthase